MIIAPDATDEAIAIVAAKKNLRLLLAGGLPDAHAPGLVVKTVAGGLLAQSRDNAVVDEMQLNTVTKRAPSDAELADLRFAFRVAKHVKSNTIVYARERATVRFQSGAVTEIPISETAQYISEKGNPRNAKQAALVTLELPGLRRFRGLKFADTPGLESALEHNTPTALASWPAQRWVLPGMSPVDISSITSSSKRRIVHMARYASTSRSLGNFKADIQTLLSLIVCMAACLNALCTVLNRICAYC